MCALVGVLIIIIIIWEAVGPQRLITKALNSEVSMRDPDRCSPFELSSHQTISEYDANAQASQGCYNTKRITLKLQV